MRFERRHKRSLTKFMRRLWSAPVPVDEEDWSLARVAASSPKTIAMILTHDEWISDVWVLRESRGLRVAKSNQKGRSFPVCQPARARNEGAELGCSVTVAD